jgi:FAD dependent oxidoreductase
MRHSNLKLAVVIKSLILSGCTMQAASIHQQSADVVIYGATPAGIAATLAVQYEGAKAIVIETTPSIGGMITGGIACTDTSTPELVGGIARKFFMEVVRRERESTPQITPSMQFRGTTIPWSLPRVWDLEPAVAAQVFEQWMKEGKTEILLQRHVVSVKKIGDRIQSIVLSDGTWVSGKIFIDASYEGDLMALAGVSSTYGRESEAEYGETLAGIRNPHFKRNYTTEEYGTPTREYMHYGQFGAELSARDKNGKLFWGVESGPLGTPGSADKRMQAFCYRLVVTQDPKMRVAWPKPEHYDNSHYELLLHYIQAHPNITFSRLIHLTPVPNGKWDLNASGPFSIDYVGGNRDFPALSYDQRRKMLQDHIDYEQGFLWFLAHDPRVLPQLRDEVNSWGLAKDEWVNSHNWPQQIYIREGRRMIGDYVMAEKDVLTNKTKDDSVGLGSFVLDSHWVRRLEIDNGSVRVEGDLDDSINLADHPYEIPYRALTPKRKEITNLLVPVCISATHIAICTVRMEPVYMILGHSAGVAAVMALKGNVAVQDIDAGALQKKLIEQGQILHQSQQRKLPLA